MSLPKGTIDKSINLDVTKTPFVIFQAHKDDYDKISKTSKDPSQKSNNHDYILAKIFFHPKNVDLIQKKIIVEIFRRTNSEYLIEKQNSDDLKFVMESIYVQNTKFSSNNIKKRINMLDNLVVESIVPGIISQIDSHFNYLKQVFGPKQIIDRPKNVSNAGLKALPSVTSIFDENFA
ncbi:MAG: hypothetical protein Satyrvirus2_29 [Satyrvirus sp.]|uniref:Minor capsid protein P8 central region domain-containing protein n=1 Tax=Satyrvirus sp. TaxID=2487771 RepID=A0A3G5ACR0_9VIRU|nr:MAG: hypothetical protein Satyrvirus2_29 [Satyrvirus sp.]